MIAQVHYDDAEKHVEDIFIENENNFNNISLPEFQNINEAPEKWIWNVLYNNLENEENKYTYEQIQDKLITLFSSEVNIEFPKDGISGLIEKTENNDIYQKIDLKNNYTVWLISLTKQFFT